MALGAIALALVAATSASAQRRVSTINLPLVGWTVVSAKKGWLEEEFKQHGVKVSLLDQGTNATAGQEAALLAKGDLHFAFRMTYPALVHKANGLDALIVWQSEPSDQYRTPLIVLKESKLQSIADLPGTTFGGARVGCGWSSPYNALRENGISLDSDIKKGDVRNLNIASGPALTSAFLGGKVDWTAMHLGVASWANLVAQDVIRVIGRNSADSEYTQGAGRTAWFALAKFTNENPEIVRSFLRARDRAAEWIKANPDEAATILARELRVPRYIAKFQIQDPSTFEFMAGEPNYQASIANIKSFQRWYKDNDDDILHKVGLSDAQIENFVDKRFFKGGEYSIYN